MSSLRLTVTFAATALLFAACGQTAVVTPATDAEKRIQEYNRVTDKQNAESPVHGTMTRMWYGALSGAEGTPANGVGFLRQFADGAFTGVINVNILPRKDGKHLVVWMAKVGGMDPIRVGELLSIVGDARHSVSFESTEDFSSRTAVIVTLEADAEPAAPGTHAVEGMLKETVVKK